MDAFCCFVGVTTVKEWADFPGRSTEDACRALRCAARELHLPDCVGDEKGRDPDCPACRSTT
jgi:hypothetical protein